MPQLLYGQDDLVNRFVISHLHPDIDDFGPSASIGIVKDAKLIAGIVFNHYYGNDIQATIASISPDWANRIILGRIFSYPFLQLNCRRLTAQTRSSNYKAVEFLERLGFKKEGQLRQWYDDDDALIFGMIKPECIWINKKVKKDQHG